MQENNKPKEESQQFDHRILAARYFEGYELQSVNGKSKRVYVGDTYWPSLDKKVIRLAKLKYTVCMAMFFAFALLGGFQRSPVNSSPLVVFFYAGSLGAGAFALTGIIRFLTSRTAMTHYSYQRYTKETGYCAPAAAFLMAGAALVSLVLMVGDLKNIGGYALPLLCFALAALLAFLVWRSYMGLPFDKKTGREPYAEREEDEAVL